MRDTYAEKIWNLTMITQYQTGRTLHIDAEQLFFELNTGLNCEFGLYMLYNASLPKEKLILGHEFLRMYDISFGYEKERIGFHGYTSDPPMENIPEDNGGKGTAILIGVAAAVLILIILGIVVCKLKQQKKLQKDLEASEERLVA